MEDKIKNGVNSPNATINNIEQIIKQKNEVCKPDLGDDFLFFIFNIIPLGICDGYSLSWVWKKQEKKIFCLFRITKIQVAPRLHYWVKKFTNIAYLYLWLIFLFE